MSFREPELMDDELEAVTGGLTLSGCPDTQEVSDIQIDFGAPLGTLQPNNPLPVLTTLSDYLPYLKEYRINPGKQ